MRYNKIWRMVVLPVFVLVVVTAALISYRNEKNSCMGVRILSEAEMSRYTNHFPQEISGWIYHNGEPAAVDAGTFTVYVSQNITEDTEYKDLKGFLTCNNPAWDMYFAADEMFANLNDAVKENHPFVLIIDTGNGEHAEYKVVFTDLPVIRMSGDRLYTAPDGVKLYGGDITVWSSNFAGTGGNKTEKSDAEWRDDDIRDILDAKRSWRVTFKNPKGNNKVNLLGLDNDDDWTFNAMNGDDTAVREKLAISLWNSISDDMTYPEGEYAEIVYNREYYGVYNISRRVDQKHLNLDSDDLLLKDKKYRRGSYVQNNYSILHGYYTEQQVWDIITDFYTNKDCSMIDIDSWIDVNLFLNIAFNEGKRDYTEMYYLWENASSNPMVYFMPVMEDAVFGITYDEDKFVFDSSLSNTEVSYRKEYQQLKTIYPDLDSRIAARYQELRNSVLKKDVLAAAIETLYTDTAENGTMARDAKRWGNASESEQLQMLNEYIEARLSFLDSYYEIK